MSQPPEPGRLSRLEWFGLISGLIGLAADCVTLLALLRDVQNSHISLTPSLNITSFSLWLITFFGVAYTVLIFSYYTRRVLMRKYTLYRKRVPISMYEIKQKKRKATRRAISAITTLVGVPLFLLHFLLLFYIVKEQIFSLDSEHLNRFIGERDATSAIQIIGAMWLIFSPIFAYVMTAVMEYLANTIYTALKK
jgi:hypothetical protein